MLGFLSQAFGQALCLVRLFVDGAAAYYGAEDLGLHVIGGRDFCQVVRKDDEVGVLAGLQLALLPFLELGIGRAAGVGADAILERDFFLRLPAAGGCAVRKLARYAGLKAAERADLFDGIIGAEGETRTAFFQSGPGVSALDALGTAAGFCPAPVGGLMRMLHGRDDFELGQARHVVRGNDLGVLDAVAAIARAIGLCYGFENVQDDMVGAVTDGVDVYLEASFVAFDGERFHLVGLHDQDAGGLGVVGIRLEHGGGARTASAIGNEFGGGRFEPRAGGAAFGAVGLQLSERQGEMHPFGDR